MASVTAESWRALPDRSSIYAELAAERAAAVDGAFLAVDHDGLRHLLLSVSSDTAAFTDDRSRGIHTLTRPLSVQGRPEKHFIDVICTTISGQDVFNLVVSAILTQLEQGGTPAEAVQTTLTRWRRFWGAAPSDGLTAEEIRGLFGELWFLASWLLPHDIGQVKHWLGPTGARHDFQWPGLALECKATTSTRGHLHRINGLDQLDPPADGRLLLFSLRMREEATASDNLTTLVTRITTALEDDGDALDTFEAQLALTGYSPLDTERYSGISFRIVNERLYEVANDFPRLSTDSFRDGPPRGVERVEYEVDLDVAADQIIATAPTEFQPPPLRRHGESARGG